MKSSSDRDPTYWVTRFMAVCGQLAIGAVAAIYSVMLSHVTVTSQEQLARVSFGWPFAWFSQDLSGHRIASFPMEIYPPLPGNRGLSAAQKEALGLPPEHIDWLLAAGSAVLWGLALWILGRFVFGPLADRIQQIVQRRGKHPKN